MGDLYKNLEITYTKHMKTLADKDGEIPKKEVAMVVAELTRFYCNNFAAISALSIKGEGRGQFIKGTCSFLEDRIHTRMAEIDIEELKGEKWKEHL